MSLVFFSQLKIPVSFVVDEINDKHMGPWAELCQIDETENTPLTPFMDSELLQHCHLNLSNEKLKATGYRLKVPYFNRESVEEVTLNLNTVLTVKCIYLFFFFLRFLDRERFC